MDDREPSRKGKNPTRVAPQLHRNLRILRGRAIGHGGAVLLLALPLVLGLWLEGIPRGLIVVCALMIPFAALGIVTGSDLDRIHPQMCTDEHGFVDRIGARTARPCRDYLR